MQFTFVSVDILEKDPTHQGCMGETDSQTRAVRDAGHETSLAGTERSRSEVCGGGKEKAGGCQEVPVPPTGTRPVYAGLHLSPGLLQPAP